MFSAGAGFSNRPGPLQSAYRMHPAESGKGFMISSPHN